MCVFESGRFGAWPTPLQICVDNTHLHTLFSLDTVKFIQKRRCHSPLRIVFTEGWICVLISPDFYGMSEDGTLCTCCVQSEPWIYLPLACFDLNNLLSIFFGQTRSKKLFPLESFVSIKM